MSKDGWLYGVKAIAGFLGVTERTVLRWMADRAMLSGPDGFPVHRVGGRWFAHPEELRRWTAGRGRSA